MKIRFITLLVFMIGFRTISIGQLIYTTTTNNENDIRIEYADEYRPAVVFNSKVKYEVTFYATNRRRIIPYVVDMLVEGTGIERPNMKGSETILPGDNRK